RVDAAVAVAQLHVQAALHLGVRLHHRAHAGGELGIAGGDVLPGNHVGVHRLEVDVDAGDVGQLGADGLLQRAARLRSFLHRLVTRQLGVHGEVQRSISLALHGHVVEVADAAVAGRGRVDALDEVAAL